MKKILMSVAAATLILGSATAASAKNYLSTTLTGTDAESSMAKLGDGKRYLVGKGTYGTGKLQAKKVVALFPDTTMAEISVANGSDQQKASFTSQSVSSSGANQSYYMKFKGNSSKASTTAKIIN